MSAVHIFGAARTAGVELWCEGERIRWRGSATPASELLATLRKHKVELLAILRGDTCRTCGEPLA